MKHTRATAVLAVIAGSVLLLTACAHGPYPGVPELLPAGSVDRSKGPAAPARVLYRIDENRYFEDASQAGHFCENGSPIYYVDKAKGIRSYVVKMDGASMGSTFIIDAANEQYLIGPATRGNTDCSSGGGSCGGARLPYSTDAGRTWKRVGALSPSDPLSVSGSTAFAIDSFRLTNSIDLSTDAPSRGDWHVTSKSGQLPQPRKVAIDNIFHCTANGKE